MPNGSGTMTGFVLDSKTKRPIKGLKMSTSGKAACVYFEKKGDYLISDTAGSYTLVLSAAGYTTRVFKIEVIDSETTRNDFRLSKK